MTENIRFPNEMKDDACFIYIEKGSNDLYSRNQFINISDKEAVLMQCGYYVSSMSGISPTEPLRSIVFHMDRAMIMEAFTGDELEFLNVKNNELDDSGALKYQSNKMMDAYIQSISPYFDYPEQVTDELLLVKMKELVLLLCNSGSSPLAAKIIGQAYSPETLEFDKVIENNLYNNLSVKELAFLTHKSESSFKRYFKKYYGKSPARFFREKRLEKSLELLKKGQLQINEIAWECGFENPAHFSTVFTAHYGRSPRVFKKELEKQGVSTINTSKRQSIEHK